MQKHNSLGIYISQDKATAVLISSDKPTQPLTAFTVTRDPQGQQSQSLGSSIMQELDRQNLTFQEASVAVDCALFTQHRFHSDLTDPKQIAQTVAFDAEEVTAADATEMAVTFNIISSDENGSDINIFAADRTQMTELLTDLQQAGIDPTSMEPDTACLAGFLADNITPREDILPIFAVFSQSSCFLVTPSATGGSSQVRSFLVGTTQDKNALLGRQVPLTIATRKIGQPINALFVSGVTEGIDCQKLGESLGLESRTFNLLESFTIQSQFQDESTGPLDIAIACQAALSEIKRNPKNDFRESFAPYQGKKLLMQKTLRVISVSVTVFALAIALYFQIQTFKVNRSAKQVRKKLYADYAAVMYGKQPSDTRSPIYVKLQSVHRQIKDKQAGIGVGDAKSVTARLTFLLEAINKTSRISELNIDKITITTSTISLVGDTDRRSTTRSLLTSIKNHKRLKVGPQNMSEASGRDKFSVTVELE